MRACDQSSIFSTGGKFHSDYGLLLVGVTRSYSSHPFLCALVLHYLAALVLMQVTAAGEGGAGGDCGRPGERGV